MTVDAISVEHVKDWFASVAEQPGSVNRAMPILSITMRMAELWGYCRHNSDSCKNAKRCRMEPKARFLSAIASAFNHAEEHGHVLDFISRRHHPAAMNWRVRIAEEFEPEFFALQQEVQDTILTLTRLLRHFGPQLGRPHVDTLKGSRHANMKEMRLSAAGGEWRVAFAFDPVRRAMLLVAGDKSGGSERRFYRALIRKADERFDRHLARLADGGEGGS